MMIYNRFGVLAENWGCSLMRKASYDEGSIPCQEHSWYLEKYQK